MDAAVSSRLTAEKQAYMSLPRPGVSTRITSITTFFKLFYSACGLYDLNSSIILQNFKIIKLKF